MRKWIIREKDVNANEKTAGEKARKDIEDFLIRDNFVPIEFSFDGYDRENSNALKKFFFHIETKKAWEKLFNKFKRGDIVVFQFPIINHSFFLGGVVEGLVSRGVTVIACIHDVECLRLAKRKDVDLKMRIRVQREEVSVLHSFSKIIVHNHSMRRILHAQYKIPKEKMVSLKMFDYLIPSGKKPLTFGRTERQNSCVVAGNFKSEKAGYVYKLPLGCEFELYGPNYEGTNADNIHYNGAYMPEELPFVLKGDFGLIWDGDSVDTCAGTYGEYLKINNPHKTSLYLACGIPVIVWKEAAVANFIKKCNCGVVISSLSQVKDVLESTSDEQYFTMKENAEKISRLLREGFFIKRAIEKCVNADSATGVH